MKFKIKKDKRHQRFWVDLSVEITPADEEKFDDHGIPTLYLKTRSGEMADVKVSDINFISSYGFEDLGKAEVYYYQLRSQIEDLQKEWAVLGDDWSGEETF